jgi:hypothetical protein
MDGLTPAGTCPACETKGVELDAQGCCPVCGEGVATMDDGSWVG